MGFILIVFKIYFLTGNGIIKEGEIDFSNWIYFTYLFLNIQYYFNLVCLKNLIWEGELTPSQRELLQVAKYCNASSASLNIPLIRK